MRWLLLVFLAGCGVTAQSPSETLKEDKELENLLGKINQNIELTIKVQDKADKKQKQIVTKAASTIKELKEELNETKAKLDSVSNDSIVPFKLLPVSH
jgi:septal ring factor EnvC (AmiA/AmiB activator)